MRLVLSAGPTVEPVTLTELKAHMRIDGDEDDTRLTALITAAREHCEIHTKRQFITATWKLYCDHFKSVLLFPRPPLQSITSVTYVDNAGTTQTLANTVYTADIYAEPGTMFLADGQTWPSTRDADQDRVIITFKAGYGDAATDVPEAIKIAMKFWIEGIWDQNKEATLACERLLAPYQVGWEY